jgi:Uma2 family endonuclease
VRKLPIYARAGVRHAWLVDPVHRTIEVLRRRGPRWILAATHGGDDKIRAEPFEALELDLSLLWIAEPRR